MFCEKSKSTKINTTQEIQLLVILLTDFFAKDDASKFPFFFNLFEPGKNSRKFLLLKFILTGIAIQSSAALNSAGAYLLDHSTKEYIISADFGRLLINEITFFANNSTEKLKTLPTLSPLFVNALSMIFAETYKEEQLPTPIVASLIVEFLKTSNAPPILYTFAVPVHVEIGAFILSQFYRWTVLSELSEEATRNTTYSQLHLKILECMSNIDPKSNLPIIPTKNLEAIADLIGRAAKVKDPVTIQKSLEKFAQLVQVSKVYFYGNVSILIDHLKALPKNALLDLVISSLK